jgi:hypothetical protein
MTIDEFKAVIDLTNMTLGVNNRYNPALARSTQRKYSAYLWRMADFENAFQTNPIGYLELEATGHTEKAALKKLKDMWYYKGRKNGNR